MKVSYYKRTTYAPKLTILSENKRRISFKIFGFHSPTLNNLAIFFAEIIYGVCEKK